MYIKKLLTALIAASFLFISSGIAANAGSYSDLSNDQKQKFWQLWKTDCQQLLMDKDYKNYKQCSLNAFAEAEKYNPPADELWCDDSDGIDYFTKGVVKTNLYPDGKEDFSYTYSNGKSYIFEGACSSNKKYFYYQKKCAELGDYKAENGACVPISTNHAPKFEDKDIPVLELTEGNDFTLYIGATDEDGDSLTFYAENLPEGANFAKGTPAAGPLNPDKQYGIFEWEPDFDQAGEYKITLSVTDGKEVDSVVVTLVVSNTNQKPIVVWLEDSYEVDEGGLLGFEFYAYDPDGDVLNYDYSDCETCLDNGWETEVTTEENGAKLNFHVTWNPTFDQAGEYELSYGFYDNETAIFDKTMIIVNNVDLTPKLIWEKNVGGTEYNAFETIKQVGDNEFLAVGTFMVKDSNDPDIWAVKMDFDGNILWENVYATPNDLQSGYDFEISDDGGYLIVGHSTMNSPGGSIVKAVLTKVNSDGKLQWTKKLGEEDKKTEANAIVKREEGFAIIGRVGDGTYYDGLLMKVTNEGDLSWSQVYFAPFAVPEGIFTTHELYAGVLTTDGGYMLGGMTGIADQQFWLIKTDASGNIEWQDLYGNDEYYQKLKSVKQTSDGGFIATGYSKENEVNNYDIWLLRVNAGGNQLWNKHFGTEGSEEGTDVIQTLDGGFAVVGRYATDIGHDGWLIKTDENGEAQWNTKHASLNGAISNYLYGLIEFQNGTYILAGHNSDPTTNGSQGWVFKIQ